jgi:hypothetical protein
MHGGNDDNGRFSKKTYKIKMHSEILSATKIESLHLVQEVVLSGHKLHLFRVQPTIHGENSR